jgi:hypothetical protein
MLKAFTPVIVMLGLLLANINTPSWRSAACVLGISVGTVINCAGTSDFTNLGLMIMLASEVYGARFETDFCTRGCHWIPRMFASSEHACDQWHSSRVFTLLTG